MSAHVLHTYIKQITKMMMITKMTTTKSQILLLLLLLLLLIRVIRVTFL